jgi:hypothetical protein
MGLTDYRVLLIDCDEVLVDRDSGVWTALQPLLEGRHQVPERAALLAEYKAVMTSLLPRFEELGFSGMLCFAHRHIAEQLGTKASWEESLTFARSVPYWPLFEDAPGAMLYLRKFYRLLVLVDRNVEDRGQLCERLGLGLDDLLSSAAHPLEQSHWLRDLGIEPREALLLSREPAQAPAQAGLCLIRRARLEHRQPCTADVCISSMADLVRQHQVSLRR